VPVTEAEIEVFEAWFGDLLLRKISIRAHLWFNWLYPTNF
jgi:hypothetical protein